MRRLLDPLAVGLGGAVGTALRYLVEAAAARLPASLAAVAAINLLGAFLIGLGSAVLLERAHTSPRWRLLLLTGLLGGFTTFGSLAAQAASLLRSGLAGGAFALLLGESALGLLATLLGLGSARLLERRV